MGKKYPSQIRYEKKNPCITFRMKKEEKERIAQMAERSGKSVSELVRMELLGLEKDFTEGYNKASKEGYDKGVKVGHDKGYNAGLRDGDAKGYDRAKGEYSIWIVCKTCGETCYIIRNSDIHMKIIDYLDSIGWEHEGCPGKFSGGTY
ncbi:MAG: ribbon-helix-helix protein, CopG family [Thermoplasmatales archaeon]|nr:MAG: ribbon-helix-helix protein, CopG family [Thermoplasmatales archaeon]